MPTYVYRREDGTKFEIQQHITEPALKKCPTTGQDVHRVITGGTGLIFKGSGFYITDYAHKHGSPSNGTQDGSPSDKPADTKSTNGSDKSDDTPDKKND